MFVSDHTWTSSTCLSRVSFSTTIMSALHSNPTLHKSSGLVPRYRPTEMPLKHRGQKHYSMAHKYFLLYLLQNSPISHNQMEKRWFAILFFLLHNRMHISYNSAANYLLDTNKKEKRNKLWQFSFLFLFLYLKFINSVYFVTLLDR